MEIITSARHFDVSDELREYVEHKVNKLGEEYGKLTTARIVLSMERNWQVAEGHVTGKHLTVEGRASTSDMYASVDEMFDKLERQVRKHLEKMQEHRKALPMSVAMSSPAAEETMDEELDEVTEEILVE